MTIALAQHLGEDDFVSIDSFVLDDFKSLDIVPRNYLNQEASRKLRDNGFVEESNYVDELNETGTYIGSKYDISSKRLFAAIAKSGGYSFELRQHAAARSVRKHVGRDTFGAYFKFALERNPWDRMVSLYFWRWKNEPGRPSFSEFVNGLLAPVDEKKALKNHGHSNWKIYTIGGKVCVDFLGKYESFADAIDQISSKIGIRITDHMPRAKSGISPSRKKVMDFYDDSTREIVANVFKKEIELLNYTVPDY